MDAQILEDGRDTAQVEISNDDDTIYVFARREPDKTVSLWFATEGENSAPADVEALWRSRGADTLAVQTLRKRNTTFKLLGFETVKWI